MIRSLNVESLEADMKPTDLLPALADNGWKLATFVLLLAALYFWPRREL